MRGGQWIAVTAAETEDDAEAFGPFSSSLAAEKFVAAYEEEGVRPAYPLMVVELQGVRVGQRLVRDEREMNEGGMR